MAETAPAAAPAKVPKKKSAAKPKTAGPGASDLIVKAVTASKERNGVSLAALKKALTAGGYDVEKNNSRVKHAIKSLVTKGTLVQTKGTGASGSFKLNKKQVETKKPAKKAAPKAKKPAAKKTAAKKSPKKAKKPAATAPKKATKSPKKATKPAAPKKVAKSPKKAAKSPKKVKAAKPKTTKPQAAKPKRAAPKKR
ncbi:Histone H1 [Triplophysa tibetana]|uniref:Histone H1 n=1 Tax=Triplophysa tibetana TaxID=1572043 RepID=A0A5A9PL47_9TELE|nr:Histone H1 [Triplophysa tibetana]